VLTYLTKRPSLEKLRLKCLKGVIGSFLGYCKFEGKQSMVYKFYNKASSLEKMLSFLLFKNICSAKNIYRSNHSKKLYISLGQLENVECFPLYFKIIH